MTTISLPPVKRVALYQLAFLLPVCAILLLWNSVLAYSVLIGGLIQICPQAWFTRQAFRYAGARKVQSIVRAMYWGETGKIVLTTVLFTVSFMMLKPLYVSALFASFVVMILVQYLAVIILLKH
jgi:ATP synthase protein I